MTLTESTALDLLNAIADVPVTFKFNGVEHTGTRGGLIGTESNTEGGLLDEPDLQITACLLRRLPDKHFTDEFPDDAPTTLAPGAIANVFKGEPLTDIDGIVGDNYRIARVHIDEFKAGIQFDLMSVHQESRGRG